MAPRNPNSPISFLNKFSLQVGGSDVGHLISQNSMSSEQILSCIHTSAVGEVLEYQRALALPPVLVGLRHPAHVHTPALRVRTMHGSQRSHNMVHQYEVSTRQV